MFQKTNAEIFTWECIIVGQVIAERTKGPSAPYLFPDDVFTPSFRFQTLNPILLLLWLLYVHNLVFYQPADNETGGEKDTVKDGSAKDLKHTRGRSDGKNIYISTTEVAPFIDRSGLSLKST